MVDGDLLGVSLYAARRKPATEIRGYVGALPIAATLLALVISTGVGASAASAQPATSPAQQGLTISSPAAVRSLSEPVLFPGAGYQPAGSGAVWNLQRLLVRAGYPPGPIDGRYGPLTERAVRRLQAARGLQADGIAGPQTWTALARRAPLLIPGAGYEPGGSGPVRDLQRLLAREGYAPGPIDGRYGPLTENAVRRFQAARRLRVDGIAGPETFADLRPQPRTPLTRGLPRPTPSHAATVHRASRRVAPRAPPSGTVPIGLVLLLVAVAILLPLTVARYALARPREALGRRGRALVRRGVALARRGVTLARRGAAAAAAGAARSRRGADAASSSRVRRGGELTVAAEQLVSSNGGPRRRGSNRAGSKAAGGGAKTIGGNPSQATDGSGSNAADGSSSNAAGHRADARDEADRAFNVGVLLEEQNDLAGAEAAYRRADERGHAAAPSNLGVLLEGQGDLVGAEAAYRRAAERGEANGAFNLGVLLEEQHDHTAAADAYRRADERGHAAAASNLGVLLEGQGDLVAAEAAYRRAAERGEANGAFNLGVLLEERGDLAGAELAYRLADQTGHVKVGQLARAALLELGSTGDPVGAGLGGGPDA
jgi:peptidoglycan hydrolase-like protein with peptidoglycan-binding domain/tetratricopeptide (TPR) repeat protein